MPTLRPTPLAHKTPLAAALLAAALATAPSLPRAATAPAPTPPASAAIEPMLAYTVTAHDTLIGLNRTLFASPKAWPEIARLNGLRDPNRITPGQTLWVPTRLLHSKAVPATLVSAFGDVRIDGQPAQAGALLPVGTPISTADASTAVVELADGSRIKLAPDTEGRLDEHRRFQIKATRAAIDEGLVAGTLRLLRGSIEVFATKVLRARPLEVSTPTAVIGVRGTAYRVRNDVVPATAAASQVDTSATEVLEGKVHAQVGASGNLAADVPANFGAPLMPGKAPQVLPLPPAPDLAALPARLDRLPARWAVAGDTPLRVQFANDAAFEHIAFDQHVAAGDPIRVPELTDGDWHMRARRISPEGLEGLDGLHAFTVNAQPAPPEPLEPIEGAKRPDTEVLLRWAPGTGTHYVIDVARDANFSRTVLHAQAQGAQAAFHPQGDAWGAAEGLYYWRIASLRPDGSAGPMGETQSFVVRPTPRAPLADLSPDGTTIEVAWGGDAGAQAQVEVARDADFQAVVKHGDFTGGRGSLPRPPAGTYWVRVRLVEPDGFQTPWSASTTVRVDSNWHQAFHAWMK